MKQSPLLVFTALLLFSASAFPAAPQEAQKPSIVLIFADDLGYGDTGCYGATQVKTPNIDRLASEGRRSSMPLPPRRSAPPSCHALLSGQAWFVGSVINEPGGGMSLPLDFLATDTRYNVTYYEDAPDRNDKTNRGADCLRNGRVKRGDTIKAKLVPGGGHCPWVWLTSQTNP